MKEEKKTNKKSQKTIHTTLVVRVAGFGINRNWCETRCVYVESFEVAQVVPGMPKS